MWTIETSVSDKCRARYSVADLAEVSGFSSGPENAAAYYFVDMIGHGSLRDILEMEGGGCNEA